MLALAAALGIGRFVYTPILPSMAEALGLSGSGAGLIASANFAGYLAGALVATIPRFPGGGRVWFVGGLLVGAATTMGMAAATGLPEFLLLRFLCGASSAFVLVLGSASVLDALARSGQLRWRWLHYSGVGLGIAVSAGIVASLEAAGVGWQGLWLATGVIAAIMSIPPALVLRWQSDAPRGGQGSRARLGPGLLVLAICHGLFGFGYVITATFLVAMVRASAAARMLEPSVWLVVGLAAFPSTAVWDWVAARIGSRRAYGVACATQAVGVAVGGLWRSAPGALLGAVLLGATIMGLTALGFAVARELGTEGQARRFAVITAAFGVGQVIGPVIGGSVVDWTGGYGVASALAAAALLVAAALIGLRSRRGSAP